MTDQEWRTRTDNRLAQIEQRINNIEKRDAVAEVHHTNVENRLKGIEGTLVWLVRSVIGALLIALIAYIINGGIAQ